MNYSTLAVSEKGAGFILTIKSKPELWKEESKISQYNPLIGDIQYLNSVHFIKGNWEDFYMYERKLGLR